MVSVFCRFLGVHVYVSVNVRRKRYNGGAQSLSHVGRFACLFLIKIMTLLSVIPTKFMLLSQINKIQCYSVWRPFVDIILLLK